MEKSARLAGYLLSLTALIGLLTIVAFLQDGNLFLRTMIKVAFPSAGTLMVDDPVKLRGVEVGRVDRIEPGAEGPLITLELYKRTDLPRDTRFVNFNYSLFGSRMVVLLPGTSAEPLDTKAVQRGDFAAGVTETIHKVDELLRTVVDYQALARRLDQGDSAGLSFQQLLAMKIYPALDGFTVFARRLEALEERSSSDLEVLARTSGQVRAWSAAMTQGTDTLVAKAQATVERLSLLTAQAVVLLDGLEKLMLASRDSSTVIGRLLAHRDLYERTLTLSHALHDLLHNVQEQGLKDIIHFWRNVKIRKRAPHP
jgi:ABC-type transporter Mla subunit MlaD